MDLAALDAAYPGDGSAFPVAEAVRLEVVDSTGAPVSFSAVAARLAAALPAGPDGRGRRLIVVLGRNLL